MSRYNPNEIEGAVLSRFVIGASDCGDPWMRCKRCGDTWSDSDLQPASYDPVPIIAFIDKAWNHFIGACK